MHVDTNIGGTVDGTPGGDIATIVRQTRDADAAGFDGVWSTEVGHNPFFPLVLAAEHSSRLGIGTSAAVAFARNPMSLAVAANDAHQMSDGRLLLGIGTQIKAHVERRFSMTWSEPVARLREYIAALREIWRCWNTGDRLDFRGDFYQHTLMPPMFRPGTNPHGAPLILMTAVGPRMTELAASAADGILLHGFTTESYMRDVTLPLITRTLEAHGRSRSDFLVVYPGFAVTADDESGIDRAARAVRNQVAFYGSTPAYAKVLEHHGWSDLHLELHRLSKEDRWPEMASLIDDDVLQAFSVAGAPKNAGLVAARRFGDIVDRFTLYTPYQIDPAVQAGFVEGVRAELRR